MRQIVLSSEECSSLMAKLELESMKGANLFNRDQEVTAELQEMHRRFHYIVVRWLQNVGYDTNNHRGL